MVRIGQLYSQENNPLQSFRWYEKAIYHDDHPSAHFRIATYYIHGIYENNTPFLLPDLASAINHLRSAAKLQDTEAMFELGQLLLTTQDSIELQQEGLYWYELAADHGSRHAQRELGNLYHEGAYSVSQDFEKAYDYFTFAAHLGDKTSALFLGTYHEHGICVPPSLEVAQTWYTVAVELGMEEDETGWWPAQLCLARVLYQCPETQWKAYALFHDIYHVHQPEQHITYLELILAQYLLYGFGGITIDQKKAVTSLLMLAEGGCQKAYFHLAQCYEKGMGVIQDHAQALKCYASFVYNPDLAEENDELDEEDLHHLAHAYYRLAEYYRLGQVVPIDLDKSNTLYQIAAERGKLYTQNLKLNSTYSWLLSRF